MANAVDPAGQSDALVSAHASVAKAIETARMVQEDIEEPAVGLVPLAEAVETLGAAIRDLLASKDA